jgi:hypothetical protein
MINRILRCMGKIIGNAETSVDAVDVDGDGDGSIRILFDTSVDAVDVDGKGDGSIRILFDDEFGFGDL